jgi:hypothetical protein
MVMASNLIQKPIHVWRIDYFGQAEIIVRPVLIMLSC